MSQSSNPFYLLGTYLGLLSGFLFFLKGWHPFWWVPALLGFSSDNLLFLDIIGGALAGFILHILFRVYRGNQNNISMKIINKK